MENFKKELEKIELTKKRISELNAREEMLIDEICKIDDIRERRKERKTSARLAENQELLTTEKMRLKFLENNANIALFNDAMPIALDILKDYAGKQYGPKTKHKICDEIAEKAGCNFFIRTSNSYSETYYLYPIGGYSSAYALECGTRYHDGKRKSLLIDNKIQIVDISEIEIFYISNEYVENIDSRIEELKTLYAAALEKQSELDAIRDKFNSISGSVSSLSNFDRVRQSII